MRQPDDWTETEAAEAQMLIRINELECALNDIKKHQEFIGGDISKMGATWTIADKALKSDSL